MDEIRRLRSAGTDPVKSGDIFRMAARSPMPRSFESRFVVVVIIAGGRSDLNVTCAICIYVFT